MSAGCSKCLRWCLFATCPAALLYVFFQYEFLFVSAASKHTTGAQGFQKLLSNCSDAVCSSFLSAWDMESYNSCTQKVEALYGAAPVNNCKFRSPTGSRLVALVSLPGSGNTWTRGLLQKVTGICTGSIVCDSSLRYEGFSGEEVHSTSVLVVKSHDTSLHWSDDHNSKHYTHFEGAIFLIRNPFHSIVSEWNRKLAKKHLGETDNSHIKNAGKEAFGTNPGWKKSVISLLWRWRLMVINYVIKSLHHPILIVYYEDLRHNVMKEMKRMLNFLDISFSTNDIHRAMLSGFDQFHRNHSDEFEHYTEDQVQLINGVINWVIDRVNQLVQKDKEIHTIHFKSYLRHI